MTAERQSTMGLTFSPHPDIHVRGITMDEGSAMTVTLDGQIRYHAVASLQEFLVQQLCVQAPQNLILDFSHVSFVDSQGLGFLISLYKFCYPQGCTLSIRGANAHVSSLIRLTRMNAFIKAI